MAIKVFRKKSDFIPFKKVGKKIVASWGFTPYFEPILDEEGKQTGETVETEYAEWYQKIYIKTPWNFEEFKKMVKEQFSNNIDEKLKQFRYNDILVLWTEEAKFNFISYFSVAQASPESAFPQTFRLNNIEENQFYTFNNIAEFGDFMNVAMNHVKDSYASGWTEEAVFDFSLYEGEPVEVDSL